MVITTSPCDQGGFRVRFDWGLTGGTSVGPGAQVVAVVDVLSFTTTLTVAAERGIEVFPYRWRDASAADYAADRKATLAVGRSEVSQTNQVSLSPASIQQASGIERVVLPSPNGSTIAAAQAALGVSVIGVCLRNAQAASAWTVRQLLEADPYGVVAVIAAGERWPDRTLRPAVEDLWGAGAYIHALTAHGLGPASPEAAAAGWAYAGVEDRISELLTECASGRELIAYGYPEDVAIAAEVGASLVVPVLRDGSFQRAG